MNLFPSAANNISSPDVPVMVVVRHDKLPRELPEYVSTARSFFKQEASHTKTYKASLTITANPYL